MQLPPGSPDSLSRSSSLDGEPALLGQMRAVC